MLETNLSQKNSLYHTSAVISSLVETATLSPRLKGSREDIAMIADHLNRRRCSRLGQLGGIVSLPFPATQTTFTDLCCNFSTGLSNKDELSVFAKRNVTQGLQDKDLAAFDAWCDLSSLQSPDFFPSIFRHTKPTSMRVTLSLVTAPFTLIPLTGYARFVEQTARTRTSNGVLMSIGLESDDAKELASASWEIVDGHGNDRMDEGSD
ncbi:uncharacterized protein BJ212DRAFT_181047 [Suillus subaureus]|uniref:Uncharacterized protein n=1 Tax=Suillus subaureus TaxID=48587 RepID=A0A9P7JDV7_9AGAM|nr:uncharacterized protein BJ212DRAFT_181047 [Suillus subaureus]KAG1816873.1 hypothetical protein BJ212DRAFT_181047 [Suillus subaureus]